MPRGEDQEASTHGGVCENHPNFLLQSEGLRKHRAKKAKKDEIALTSPINMVFSFVYAMLIFFPSQMLQVLLAS
jgi:hypothetical protein